MQSVATRVVRDVRSCIFLPAHRVECSHQSSSLWYSGHFLSGHQSSCQCLLASFLTSFLLLAVLSDEKLEESLHGNEANVA